MWRLQLLVAASALSLTRRESREEPLFADANLSSPLGSTVSDALNFSNPEVPTVPVGSDMEAVAQALDAKAAAEQVEPPVEGGSPTFAPLDGRPVEAKTVGDYQDDVSKAIAGTKDDVARLGLKDCGCECCMGVRRAAPTETSNWTCTPVPDYLVPKAALMTDTVAPPVDSGTPTAPAVCLGTDVSECGARAQGADLDEVLEALTYSLFCATHCRAIGDETATPCMTLNSDALAAAWHDGTWTDPLAPSVDELKRSGDAAAQAAAMNVLAPEPELASAGEARALHGAEQVVAGLTEPVAASMKAVEHANSVVA